MTRNSSIKNKRKRQSVTPSKSSLGTTSDSDGAIGDHPDTNAINRTLSNLYMTGQDLNTPRRDVSMKEDRDESEANKEIEKALKKKARLKERYIYSPSATFDDLGGLDTIICDLKNYLDPNFTLKTIELGSSGRKRILISGLTGVGKTKLVEGIINHCELPSVMCTFDLLSGNPTEVQSSCKNLFNFARSMQPCILVIDQLDCLVPKQVAARTNNEREIMTRILIRSLEELNNENANITIIGVTNSVDSLDLSFMNAARFTMEIKIDVPDEKTRGSILQVICKNVKLSSDVKFNEIAAKTVGYVGADLRKLVDEACIIGVARLINMNIEQESERTVVTQDDFQNALSRIKPSLKSDGFASIPTVTWEDIGACDHIRSKLRSKILLPIKYPDFNKKIRRGKKSCGILLHGPPGCGKTSIAKAMANEGGISFISVKGPEVLNKYVGESERGIRDIFEKAEKAKPCVIFFDEIDALCQERASSERSNVTQSVLSQILTEMDGFDNQSCFVLAATNRIDVLDSAILRPGRFDNHIFVGIPDAPARLDILKAITRNNKPPLSPEVSLQSLAYDDRLRNFTGADLNGLIERAIDIASDEMENKLGTLDEEQFLIKLEHIESALRERGTASITDEMLEFYLKSAKKFGLA